MNISIFVKAGAAVLLLAILSSCGNTIRGMGNDAANTVNATQDAERSVQKAAKY